MTKARAFVAAGALLVGVLGGSGAVAAQSQSHADSDYVGRRSATVTRDPAEPQTRVLGRTMTRSAPIPITGGDVAGLALLGAGAIGTGTLLVWRGRRAHR